MKAAPRSLSKLAADSWPCEIAVSTPVIVDVKIQQVHARVEPRDRIEPRTRRLRHGAIDIRVRARAARHVIGAKPAGQRVVLAAADEHIVTGAAPQHEFAVGFGRTVERQHVAQAQRVPVYRERRAGRDVAVDRGEIVAVARAQGDGLDALDGRRLEHHAGRIVALEFGPYRFLPVPPLTASECGERAAEQHEARSSLPPPPLARSLPPPARSNRSLPVPPVITSSPCPPIR